MNCLVTAGPTYEPLDEVRRLTNFSSGKLGAGLANFLSAHGHHVTLLLGHYATFRGPLNVREVQTFTTTADLQSRLADQAGSQIQAVFHAAAVSDFAFGRVFERMGDGCLIERRERKIATASGTLLAELKPTPKLVGQLRDWFPNAWLVGWKYEAGGDRETAINRAREQIGRNRTNACVANGPAYGSGYGLVVGTAASRHCATAAALYGALSALLG